MVLFSKLELPKAWRPLFREFADLGWDLDHEEEVCMDWATRPSLRFRNGVDQFCYLSFFILPMWCGNIRQSSGITVVGLTKTLPQTRVEAEACSISLEANWEEEIGEFLALGLA